MKYVWKKIRMVKKGFNTIEWNKYQTKDKKEEIRKEVDKIAPPWVAEDIEEKVNKYCENYEKKQQQEDLDGSFVMEELVQAVNYTKEKLAPGRNNIEYRMLKELSDKFMKELLVIFNWCYERGNQIEEWQEHRTIFIDKGDKEKVRLITLASRVRKVLERIINERLIWWPEKSEKYEQNQNGFRRGKLCIENIARLVEIEIAKRENKHTIAAYLNVSSAYDNVRREILMQKLIKKECPRKIVRYVNS